MRNVLFLFILLLPTLIYSQRGVLTSRSNIGSTGVNDSLNKSNFGTGATSNVTPEAPIDLYKIISIKNDSIIADTTLSIRKEYRVNYLRKDLFGRLALPNEGQAYNLLDFGLTDFSPNPEMGFKAKHFAYEEVADINYYHVPTPMTDLLYRSAVEQGQLLDAFITVNTSERLNLSISYKGLRSVGKYINALSSNGNFRLTTSYRSEGNRYVGRYHLTAQDFENGENGGIVNIDDFESGKAPFTERARLEVFYKDATSYLEGRRLFTDQIFRVNKEKAQNNLSIAHRFYYENKAYSFSQKTPNDRLGQRYVSSNIYDKTNYNQLYNRIGASYENESLGDFMFFVDDHRYNYFYNRATLSQGNIIIPNKLNETINSVGGQYTYYKNNWKGVFLYSRSIGNQDLSNLDLYARYKFDKDNTVEFKAQNINKLPNAMYNLYQSDYVGYNWSNNFSNQKINNIEVQANLKWFEASAQFSNMRDYLYFSNSATMADQLITTPKQYDKSINYMGIKIAKEFRLGKFALDNTILYQGVSQSDDILNVPQIVTRHSFYYSDYVFRKAMFIQTGFTVNYFTEYYADNYNGVIGEFYVQDQKKIGNFPTIDFFINAKVSTAQIFLKAEHFNSSFTGYNFYSTPNQPYRDFIIRFGISWKFFS